MALPRARSDVALTVFGLLAAAYEIVWGGGRFTVFAFLSTLLGVPIIANLESARREKRGKGST